MLDVGTSSGTESVASFELHEYDAELDLERLKNEQNSPSHFALSNQTPDSRKDLEKQSSG